MIPKEKEKEKERPILGIIYGLGIICGTVQIASLPEDIHLKKKLGDRMIKQLLNSVIVKYRYFSVSRRSIISSPQTNHDILLNLVQQLLIIWRVSHFYRSIYRDVKNHKLTRKQEAFAPITGAS